jgi:hypothetical protein
VISVVGVFQITEHKIQARPAESLWLAAELLVAEPITTLGLLAGIIWAVRAAVHNPANNRFMRWIFRLLQPYDLRVAILLFLSLAILSVAAIAFLILAF